MGEWDSFLRKIVWNEEIKMFPGNRKNACTPMLAARLWLRKRSIFSLYCSKSSRLKITLFVKKKKKKSTHIFNAALVSMWLLKSSLLSQRQNKIPVSIPDSCCLKTTVALKFKEIHTMSSVQCTRYDVGDVCGSRMFQCQRAPLVYMNWNRNRKTFPFGEYYFSCISFFSWTDRFA